ASRTRSLGWRAAGTHIRRLSTSSTPTQHDCSLNSRCRAKIFLPCEMKQILGKLHRNVFILAKIGATLNQIARLAAAERTLVRIIYAKQIFNVFGVIFEAHRPGILLKNGRVHLPIRRVDIETITHAAKKRVIHEIARIEVGCENEELLERYFNFLSCMKG